MTAPQPVYGLGGALGTKPAAPVVITPKQHAHFLSLGQIIGLALLGLQAYNQQDAPGSGGPAVLLNPAVIVPYLQGILSLFPPPTE